VDGAAEVRRRLQQTESRNRETCGAVRQFNQNRPADGFPK